MTIPTYTFTDWSAWTADDGTSGAIDWDHLTPVDLHPAAEAIRQALREAQEMVIFAMPARDANPNHAYALSNAPFFRTSGHLLGSMIDCTCRELPFVELPWWKRTPQTLTDAAVNPESARWLFADYGASAYGDPAGVARGADLMRLLVTPGLTVDDAAIYGAVASTAGDGTRTFDRNMTAPLARGFWTEFPHPTLPAGRLWRSYVAPEVPAWPLIPGQQTVMSLPALKAIKEAIQQFTTTVQTSRFPASFLGKRMIGQDLDTSIKVFSRSWAALRGRGWGDWFWRTGDAPAPAPDWESGEAWSTDLADWAETECYSNGAWWTENVQLSIQSNLTPPPDLMWATVCNSRKACRKSVLVANNIPLGRLGKSKTVTVYMRRPQYPIQAAVGAYVDYWTLVTRSFVDITPDPAVTHGVWEKVYETTTTDAYCSFQLGDTTMPTIPEPAALPADLTPPFTLDPMPDPMPEGDFPNQTNVASIGAAGVQTLGTLFNYQHPDSQGDLVVVIEHTGFKFARSA